MNISENNDKLPKKSLGSNKIIGNSRIDIKPAFSLMDGPQIPPIKNLNLNLFSFFSDPNEIGLPTCRAIESVWSEQNNI